MVGGAVALGEAEPFLLLLTGDPDGYPRHCALSRTELAVVGSFLDIALYARRTGDNLQRGGAATLLAVDQDEIVSFRLATSRILPVGGLLGVRFDVLGSDTDSLGVELRPPAFIPTAELAAREHWEATRRALDALRESHHHVEQPLDRRQRRHDGGDVPEIEAGEAET